MLKLYTWLNFVVYKANVNKVVTEMKIKLSTRKNYYLSFALLDSKINLELIYLIQYHIKELKIR